MRAFLGWAEIDGIAARGRIFVTTAITGHD
jgi:hypothetical protein